MQEYRSPDHENMSTRSPLKVRGTPSSAPGMAGSGRRRKCGMTETAFARASLLILLQGHISARARHLWRGPSNGPIEACSSRDSRPSPSRKSWKVPACPSAACSSSAKKTRPPYNEERPLRPPAKLTSTLSSGVTHDHAITSAAPGIPARQRSRQHHPEVGHARAGP